MTAVASVSPAVGTVAVRPGLSPAARWVIAAPLIPLSVFGPYLVVLLTIYAWQGLRVSQVYHGSDVPSLLWLAAVWAVILSAIAFYLSRRMASWPRFALPFTAIYLVPMTLLTLVMDRFDTVERPSGPVMIAGCFVSLGLTAALSLLIVRLLTAPGLRVAASPLEITLPLRGPQGRVRVQVDRIVVDCLASRLVPNRVQLAVDWGDVRAVQPGVFTAATGYPVGDTFVGIPAGPGLVVETRDRHVYLPLTETHRDVLAAVLMARGAYLRDELDRRPFRAGHRPLTSTLTRVGAILAVAGLLGDVVLSAVHAGHAVVLAVASVFYVGLAMVGLAQLIRRERHGPTVSPGPAAGGAAAPDARPLPEWQPSAEATVLAHP